MTTKKILAVICSLLLVFGLCACGGSGGSTSGGNTSGGNTSGGNTSGGSAANNVPRAEFDPYNIHPGRVDDNYIGSDVWYPVDSPDSMPMYFLFASPSGHNDALIEIRWMGSDGYDYANCFTAVDGMKLVSAPGEDFEVEFIFPDALTAYDTISKTLYSRANHMDNAALERALVDTSYCSENGEGYFMFENDGTVVQNYQGLEYTGRWMVAADTVLIYLDDKDTRYDNYFQIIYTPDGAIESIYADPFYYYPAVG